MKTCVGCKRHLPASDFATDNLRPDGKGYYYKNRCKPCWQLYRAELKNREYREEEQIAERRALPPEGFSWLMQSFLRASAC